MFRKPREAAETNSESKPSTGRPPTPPHGTAPPPQSTSTPNPSTRTSSTKPLVGAPKPNMAPSKSASKTPAKTPAKRPSTTPRKSFREKQGKPNGSILSFFKKAEPREEEDDDALFLAESQANAAVVRKSTRAKAQVFGRQQAGAIVDKDGAESIEVLEEGLFGMKDNGEDATPFDNKEDRYNEDERSVKRRRTSGSSPDGKRTRTNSPEKTPGQSGTNTPMAGLETCSPPPPQPKPKMVGAFIDHSDSEDDVMDTLPARQQATQNIAVAAEKVDLDTKVDEQPASMNENVSTEPINQDEVSENRPIIPPFKGVKPLDKPLSQSIPHLKRESTSFQTQDHSTLNTPDEISDDEFTPTIDDAKDYSAPNMTVRTESQ